MKKIFYTILLLSLAVFVYGEQHTLTAEKNMMRSEDEIIKQQVDYKNPGRSGDNVLWDFGMLNLQNDAYKLFYTEGRNNRMQGMEHNTRYYYELRNDSLFRTGFENHTTLSVNEQPELLLKFPVQYGDSTFSYYNSNGRYSERLKISTMGTTKTKADARGMMILPNGDTLKNVLRIRTNKKIAESTTPLRRTASKNVPEPYVSADSIEFRLQNDTVLLEVETYQWYVKGYRYPIFETVKSITNKHGEITDFFDVAFFYPPQEHYYLEDDPENLFELTDEENNPDDEQENGENDEQETGENNSQPIFTYNIYPNPVQHSLWLEYYTEKPATVTISLYNMQRHLLYNTRNVCQQGDVRHIEINMSPFFVGHYMLIIDTGYEIYNEVIFKQ